VWDCVAPGETMPRPAVLNPARLEALIARHGYTDFRQAREPATAGGRHKGQLRHC
jgi:hypothetical protein